MKIRVKNQTGYDIRDCAISTGREKEEFSLFRDGDSVLVEDGLLEPRLVWGYICNEYGRKVIVSSKATNISSSSSRYHAIWVFRKLDLD